MNYLNTDHGKLHCLWKNQAKQHDENRAVSKALDEISGRLDRLESKSCVKLDLEYMEFDPRN